MTDDDPTSTFASSLLTRQLIGELESDKRGEALKELSEKIGRIKTEGNSAELPKYRCHKEVWALKIAAVIDPRVEGEESDGSRMLIFENERTPYAPIRVDHAYVSKHKPEAGGYYVVYADGYLSFSPAKAFEDGYTRVDYTPRQAVAPPQQPSE